MNENERRAAREKEIETKWAPEIAKWGTVVKMKLADAGLIDRVKFVVDDRSVEIKVTEGQNDWAKVFLRIEIPYNRYGWMVRLQDKLELAVGQKFGRPNQTITYKDIDKAAAKFIEFIKKYEEHVAAVIEREKRDQSEDATHKKLLAIRAKRLWEIGLEEGHDLVECFLPVDDETLDWVFQFQRRVAGWRSTYMISFPFPGGKRLTTDEAKQLVSLLK